MNKKRDFLRGISPNDVLLTAAALAMIKLGGAFDRFSHYLCVDSAN